MNFLGTCFHIKQGGADHKNYKAKRELKIFDNN